MKSNTTDCGILTDKAKKLEKVGLSKVREANRIGIKNTAVVIEVCIFAEENGCTIEEAYAMMRL